MQPDPPDDRYESRLNEVYHASSGEAPHLPYHVRDELALIRLLPKCALATLDREAVTRVALATYPAALWLPTVEHAELMEGPEPAWQGWQWGLWEYLVIYVSRDPGLPKLGQLTTDATSSCQLTVGDSPMRLRRLAPGHSQWRGEGFAGEISGFLDERTRFWAQSVAPTQVRRDELLAAVATLSRAMGS
jgi:hypothetical protein